MFFFGFLLLKIFTGHNIENIVRNFDAKCIKFKQVDSISTIYSMRDTRHCLSVTRDH